MKHPFSWAGKRPGIIPVFFLSLFQALTGQVNFPDARSLALGSCLSQAGPMHAQSINPADIPAKNLFSVGSGHLRPFTDAGIGINSVSFNLPAGQGLFKSVLKHTGIEGFRQNRIYLSYGLKLGEKLSAGVGFIVDNIHTNEKYMYLWSIGLKGGIGFDLSAKTRLSLYFEDPITINNYDDYGPLYPGRYAISLSHCFYDQSYLNLEYEIRNDGRDIMKLSIEFLSTDRVSIRSGYHSDPFTLSVGAGIKLGKLILDFAEAWSVNLGHTPAIGIIYIPGS